jgi:Tol biopolymer transport system component
MPDGLSAREHDEMRDMVLAGTQHIRPAGAHRGQLVAAGVSLVLIGAIAGGAVTATLRAERMLEPVAPLSPSPTVADSEGWVAYSSPHNQGDIYFVRTGEAPRRVVGSEDDGLDHVCPAFSPDGTRLASGQSAGDEQAGWRDAAVLITELDLQGEAGASSAIPLDGLDRPPCPIWAPNGRWVAFGAQAQPGAFGVSTEVWVVDISTSEVRRLTGLRATDIEWTPDGSQLYIADESGVLIYSIAEDDTRVLQDTAGAVTIAASTDGTALAVEQHTDDSSEVAQRFDLMLMDADGADRRILIEDYTRGRGIGPIWSPDGSRIVLQRSSEGPARSTGEYPILGENDEVVILSLGEDDPLGPIGTQTVLATQSTEGSEPRHWLPEAISWAPDGATLRLIGWELKASGDMGAGSGLLTVPVDPTVAPTILWETPEGIGSVWVFPRNDFQSWSTR